jgi:hypothetical protein
MATVNAAVSQPSCHSLGNTMSPLQFLVPKPRHSRVAGCGDFGEHGHTSGSPPLADSPASAAIGSCRPIRQLVWAILIVGAFLAVVGDQSWVAGTRLRDYIWVANRENHYISDISNAFNRGRHVLELARALDFARHRADSGELTTADQFTIGQILEAMDLSYKEQQAGGGNLDYPPGRLFIASMWARWAAQPGHFPGMTRWTDGPGMFVSEPMLRLNTWAAAESAVAMFLLVFLWVLRSGRTNPVSPATAAFEPWWPCHAAIAAVASAVGLLVLIRFTVLTGDWPSDIIWLGMGILFIVLIVSVNRLPTAHRAWACGLIAAEMVWFDPAVLAVSHVWPQWDIWSVPFFITAALCASLDLWFLAGALLAAGAMFKAQSLLGAPILVLWPLLGGRWGATLRTIGGFLTAGVALLWTFLVPSADYTFLVVYPQLQHWIVLIAAFAAVSGCMVAAARLALRFVLRLSRQSVPPGELLLTGDSRPERSRLAPAFVALVALTFAIVCLAAISRMQPAGGSTTENFAFGLLAVNIVCLPWLIPSRHLPAWLLTTVAATVLLGQYFFQYHANGNWAWYDIGFVYGTGKFPRMQMGAGVFSNLPVLLTHMGWISNDIHERVATLTLPFWGDLSIDRRTELGLVYLVMLVLCAAGAARHARRNDPRVLISLTAPWFLFPALMPQMSERYLLMGSAISACAIAVSCRLTIVHIAIGVTSALMTMDQILDSSGAPTNFPFSGMASSNYPASGWIVLACAAVFFLASVLPLRRRSILRIGNQITPASRRGSRIPC